MAETKIGPSDLRAEAEKMLREGTMPNLDSVLGAVAASREEFADRIRKSRTEKDAKDSKDVTFKADPATTVKPVKSPQTTDPGLFGRDDVKQAASKVWTTTSAGTRGTEGGFFIASSPDGYVVVPHSFTNETGAITTKMVPNAEAEVHVHPNYSIPEPSNTDKKVADTHKIDIYTIHSKGIYRYDHNAKTTTRLGNISDFLK